MNNFVIINAVPINGGDEALLKATILGLQDYFDKPEITVLTNNLLLSRKYIKDVNFDWDWEYAFMKADQKENRVIFRLKKYIRVILSLFLDISYYHSFSRLFSSRREKRVYNILNNSDLILLAAGGYIHDFYGYDARLKTLKFINDNLKKPYVFFSQSIGPFWIKKNYPGLIKAFDNAKFIILREAYSKNHLKAIGYHCKNVFVSNDIAFYLHTKFNNKTILNKSLNRIAINFREWSFEQEGVSILDNAKILCEYLIDSGFELSFISTCQGVSGYIDDSMFARKILNTLSSENRRHCIVLDEKYTLEKLVSVLNQHDAYIGMRLHGAILSLLSGNPALNIAYEDKSLGIYDLLGLEKYCFSYKEDKNIWIEKTQKFIDNHVSYQNDIEKITKYAAERVKYNFELLVKVMEDI